MSPETAGAYVAKVALMRRSAPLKALGLPIRRPRRRLNSCPTLDRVLSSARSTRADREVRNGTATEEKAPFRRGAQERAGRGHIPDRRRPVLGGERIRLVRECNSRPQAHAPARGRAVRQLHRRRAGRLRPSRLRGRDAAGRPRACPRPGPRSWTTSRAWA